ncbi:MAG: LamG domain-containing protein [Pseudomonadota bacterium]
MRMTAIAAAVLALAAPLPASAQMRTVWTFDRLDRIGGLAPRVEGQPVVVATPLGKAVAFDGVDDALFLDRHPLAGAKTFTIEAVFRPDGGAFEQRWLHLAENGPGGEPGDTRLMFEIRVVGNSWYLDAFANGPGYKHTLVFPQTRYPVGQWYHVAQSFDGKTYRAYVAGILQGEAEIAYAPQGAGQTSAGTRINRRNYFHGAIRQVRFTRRALKPAQFLKLP